MDFIYQVILRCQQIARSRPRGWWRIVANYLAFQARMDLCPAGPTQVTIEPTNRCDHRCPACYKGSGRMSRAIGDMSLVQARRVVDEVAKTAFYVEMFNMGESFLNHDVYDIIRYAKDKGLLVDLDTNGVSVDPERVVASGLGAISFHIAGVDQQTHVKYRIGGNLPLVLSNIRETVKMRNERNSDLIVKLGLLVNRYSETQVDEFCRIAADLGVDYSYLLQFGLLEAGQAGEFLPQGRQDGVWDEVELANGRLRRKEKAAVCSSIWFHPVVSWNGDVHVCTRDHFDEWVLGNVLDEPMRKIWNNSRTREARRRLRSGEAIMEICNECPGYGFGSSLEAALERRRHKRSVSPLRPSSINVAQPSHVSHPE